jgi:hypothetical protein
MVREAIVKELSGEEDERKKKKGRGKQQEWQDFKLENPKFPDSKGWGTSSECGDSTQWSFGVGPGLPGEKWQFAGFIGEQVSHLSPLPQNIHCWNNDRSIFPGSRAVLRKEGR